MGQSIAKWFVIASVMVCAIWLAFIQARHRTYEPEHFDGPGDLVWEAQQLDEADRHPVIDASAPVGPTQRTSGRLIETVNTADEAEVRRRLAALLGTFPNLDADAHEYNDAEPWCSEQAAKVLSVPQAEARRIVAMAMTNAATEEGLTYVDALSDAAAQPDADQRRIRACAVELAYALPD